MPDTDPNYNLNQPVFNKGRKDKFILVFTLPPILRDWNSKLLSERSDDLVKQDALQYSIWGSPVPDVGIPAIAMNYDGQPYKVTSQDRQPYPPITVNFTVDNRFSNWWIIWKWMDILNAHRESGMPDYFGAWDTTQRDKPGESIDARVRAESMARSLLHRKTQTSPKNVETRPMHMQNDFLAYQTMMTIYGLDEYNEKVVQFDYHNAFPTVLAGIQYNYRDEKEIESSFQFEFSQMSVNLIGPKY